ncbi:hypothetical protein BDV26DRAFT_295969 [Aspergillus bertholletiae]|uniref:Uncharacterized protein n=1 Tax=Aspergillus bertholletiae TaxID=1226010 RepID=A0A5N7AX93_9EURO|nr:hypothetical protein BDV26DRAFT_295969 [Aspergillus bertholletiae]
MWNSAYARACNIFLSQSAWLALILASSCVTKGNPEDATYSRIYHDPKGCLERYLQNYERHRDRRLKNDISKRLSSYRFTIWTGWDRFVYDQALQPLRLFELISDSRNDFPGVTIHPLVQWRAKAESASGANSSWALYHASFMAAAASIHALVEA